MNQPVVYEIEGPILFNDQINQGAFQNKYYALENWPVVYFLNNTRSVKPLAYVGETTNVAKRMQDHLKNNDKSVLEKLHIINSRKFNKSATLDIESYLINYLHGEGSYQLLNGNGGQASHNYHEKKYYWQIFKDIWQDLYSKEIVRKTLSEVSNNDLFKYSPYKSLTTEQTQGLTFMLKCILNDNINNIIMQGGAGTGKTILAIFLFKLLKSSYQDVDYSEFKQSENEIITLVQKIKEKYPNGIKMGLVIAMSSFRNTLKKVFSNIKDLNSNMVLGPGGVVGSNYDLLIVDEAHRLRQRKNITNYASFDEACKKLGLDNKKSSELDWITQTCPKRVFFYDSEQSVRPSDVDEQKFNGIKCDVKSASYQLTSQLRSKGSNDYVEFITNLLHQRVQQPGVYSNEDYELKLFTSISDFVNAIKKKNRKYGLCRMIAGYAWPWKSKNNPNLNDIEIEDLQLQWNRVADDWINSTNAEHEVGCIHTTQGYDLNYAGIIIGEDLYLDPVDNKIKVNRKKYYDRNGSAGVSDDDMLRQYIINIYKTVLLRGIMGTYIYICDENLRNYFSKHIQTIKPTAKILSIDEIQSLKNIVRFFDLKAAAGSFSEIQAVNEKDKKWLEIDSNKFADESRYFCCEVVGESMNKKIPNGSICLFEYYNSGSRNGEIVLAELNDRQNSEYGTKFTVKKYESVKQLQAENWQHDKIILSPVSNQSAFMPLEFNIEDEIDSLKIIGIFKQVLWSP